MVTVSASYPYSENTDAEHMGVMLFDEDNFLAEARQRMDARLKKIRGEETESGEKILSVSNENSR